jgi:hypothetical protein
MAERHGRTGDEQHEVPYCDEVAYEAPRVSACSSLSLRVLDCIVTVLFGVCLALWLFELVL